MMTRLLATAFLAFLLPRAILPQARGGPSFEVASVKPMSAAEEGRQPSGLFTYAGGRIKASNYPLRRLIQEAFNVESYCIIGGPSWAETEPYMVEAKPPESSPSSKWVPENFKSPPNPEMRLMLQNLLADRFQLKVHRESRPGSVYALVVAKGGPRLKPPKNPAGAPFVSFGRNGPVTAEATFLTLIGQNATLNLLASRLADILRAPVNDQTAIHGNFDFVVEYAGNDRQSEVAPFLVQAVREIGLELKKQRGSIEVLVIDQAQRPTPN